MTFWKKWPSPLRVNRFYMNCFSMKCNQHPVYGIDIILILQMNSPVIKFQKKNIYCLHLYKWICCYAYDVLTTTFSLSRCLFPQITCCFIPANAGHTCTRRHWLKWISKLFYWWFSCDTADIHRDQGPISLTFFPSQFIFDGNFVSLLPWFSQSYHYKILYMAQQLCCRGMCKNLLRYYGQQWNYSKVKFTIEFELWAKSL